MGCREMPACTVAQNPRSDLLRLQNGLRIFVRRAGRHKRGRVARAVLIVLVLAANSERYGLLAVTCIHHPPLPYFAVNVFERAAANQPIADPPRPYCSFIHRHFPSMVSDRHVAHAWLPTVFLHVITNHRITWIPFDSLPRRSAYCKYVESRDSGSAVDNRRAQ